MSARSVTPSRIFAATLRSTVTSWFSAAASPGGTETAVPSAARTKATHTRTERSPTLLPPCLFFSMDLLFLCWRLFVAALIFSCFFASRASVGPVSVVVKNGKHHCWPQGGSAENLLQWPPCGPGEHQQNASSPEIVPPLAVAKIHCPEIRTSRDRNLASHILLALPCRF